MPKPHQFTQLLLQWHKTTNDRQMPWKGIKNPYFIWLSEVILQQTRVEQGLPYYEKFTRTYPTIHDLANAPEDDVMKLWQGLGYYSRARNLHNAAKYVSEELNGNFPNNYKDILKLKGVGPYTAAAIASFAYDLPHAVVDGNVYRVLSRYFGIDTPIDSTEGKKQFFELANELIAKKEPAAYNQAIMDFGAKQCTPAKPMCMFCSMNNECVAFLTGKTGDLPIKSKKIVKKTRFFNYLLIKSEGFIFIQKRTGEDIWKNLYQLPMIETSEEVTNWQQFFESNKLGGNISFDLHTKSKQTLTHRYILGSFVEVESVSGLENVFNDLLKVKIEDLKNFAFPKIVNDFLGKMNLV